MKFSLTCANFMYTHTQQVTWGQKGATEEGSKLTKAKVWMSSYNHYNYLSHYIHWGVAFITCYSFTSTSVSKFLRKAGWSLGMRCNECAYGYRYSVILQDANLIEIVEKPGIPAPAVTALPSPPETPPPPEAVAMVVPPTKGSGKEKTGCSISCGCWELVKVN